MSNFLQPKQLKLHVLLLLPYPATPVPGASSHISSESLDVTERGMLINISPQFQASS